MNVLFIPITFFSSFYQERKQDCEGEEAESEGERDETIYYEDILKLYSEYILKDEVANKMHFTVNRGKRFNITNDVALCDGK